MQKPDNKCALRDVYVFFLTEAVSESYGLVFMVHLETITVNSSISIFKNLCGIIVSSVDLLGDAHPRIVPSK